MAGRVRRALLGLVLLSGSVAVSSSAAAAAERPAGQLQWRGYAGEVILTDCSPTDAPGTECTGWSVFAFRERIAVQGDRHAHRGLSVVVYDVTITNDPLVPAVEYRSEGFTEDADVTVTPNLSRASASGTVDQYVCDPEDCEPTGDAVDVDVAWTAAGRAERYRDRFHDSQERGELLNVMFFGTFRPATAVAEIDGEPVAVVPVQIVGTPPLLHFDASTELCVRCGFPEP